MKLGPSLLLFLFWPPFYSRAQGPGATAAGTPQDSSACPWRAGRGPFHKLNCSYRLPLSLGYTQNVPQNVELTAQHSTGRDCLRASPVLWPLDIHPRERESQPLASERTSVLEKIMHSHSVHNKKLEVSDYSDLELKRLSLKRKTRHLPAKINCDES